jgi:hypothetical protein
MSKPEKEVFGIPYDFDKPTVARAKSRLWNPEDKRIFTPKVYGAGWAINFYWLVHLVKYYRRSDH